MYTCYNTLFVWLLVSRSTIRLFCSLFKVRHIIGWINHDIVVSLCPALLGRLSFYLVNIFWLTWGSNRGPLIVSSLLYPQTRAYSTNMCDNYYISQIACFSHISCTFLALWLIAINRLFHITKFLAFFISRISHFSHFLNRENISCIKQYMQKIAINAIKMRKARNLLQCD